MLEKGVFPDDLKHGDVVTAHKKKDKSDKTNDRPVIVLPNFQKNLLTRTTSLVLF